MCNLQANVEMMLEFLPLSQFKAIYIVDLCASLCKQVRAAESALNAAESCIEHQPSAHQRGLFRHSLLVICT